MEFLTGRLSFFHRLLFSVQKAEYVELPHQSLEAVEASIQTVKRNGLTPVPTYYTPIPHTALWKEAEAVSAYNLEADPVFSNNALFPCMPEGFSWKIITRLKIMCQ